MSDVELVIAAFLLLTFVAALLSLRLRVPYTLVLVFIGMSVTAVATLIRGMGPAEAAAQGVIAQTEALYNQLIQGGSGSLFVGLVVPPLIFEAMMHVQVSDLRAVIRPSMALATVGVVVATLIGGVVLWQLAGLSLSLSFLFAALISPTDTVTVLEVFKRVKVPSKLSALLDTEAAFNDATGIVIFSIVLSSVNLPRVSIADALVAFVVALSGGIAVGLVIAFSAERMTRLIDDRVAETILTVSAVYGSYALAAGIGASGLIAVAVVGLYFGNVTLKAAIGPVSRVAVTIFWELAAFIGNSIAFLFIGFQTNILALGQSALLIAAAYVAVIVARMASTYPILAIFSRLGNKMPRSWSNLAVLGGVRGALSIALASSITASAVISAADVSTISTMVLGVAFLSLTVQVPLIFRYAKRWFAAEEPAS